MEGKDWGILSHNPQHDRHMSSHLLSATKWCMRPILHSVLATKMNNRRQRATLSIWSIPKMLLSESTQLWSRGRHYLELHCLHLSPSAVTLQTWICFTGRTYMYLSSGTCFGSLTSSVAVDKNVNMLLHLESITSAMLQITWWNSPASPSIFAYCKRSKLEV